MLRWKLKFNDKKSKVLVVGKSGEGMRWKQDGNELGGGHFQISGVCFGRG